MSSAIRGRMVTVTFATSVLPSLRGAAAPAPDLIHALDRWSDRCERTIGPASSARAIADIVVLPLLRLLGFEATARPAAAGLHVLDAGARGLTLPVVVAPYGEPLDRVWRSVVLDGVRSDARWGLCCNGIALRIVDSARTWSRHFLEFDLAQLSSDDVARTLLWSVVRAEALAARPPVLDVAVDLSARHGISLCQGLGRGVLEALDDIMTALGCGHPRSSQSALFDRSLTVVYRILFLLFAEARGLVPMWHPVYREHYSIEAIVQALAGGRRYRGIWQAVQAISRLAHAGCSAGELKVTAFNGRLFASSPGDALERVRIPDEAMAHAMLAVSTTTMTGRGRERIAYRDLDVEQLGAVYEQVLERQPSASPGAPLVRTREARKASSTFYTPRALTAWLVRRTLEPIVANRSADAILQLRILDPAMGSGAFLVGACRYLSAALEDAMVREGRWHPGEITVADRVGLRRDIAQRCLFGVDVNPTAVQLARLSLWLATLASDKPLSFLDHRLVAGDSLVGATVDDVRRQPPGGQPQRRRPEPLPLFDDDPLQPVLQHAVRTRLQLALEPDDSVAAVRAKEQALTTLDACTGPLARWRRVLDLWCAGWFWEDGHAPAAAVFGTLCDELLRDRSSLPSKHTEPLLRHAQALASRHGFFHWRLAFPEVFTDADGGALPQGGFDAIIGNPPWDMVRGDSGAEEARASRKADAQRLTGFVRDAGVYRIESRAHVNRYQLFVERALQLVRPGGRIGLVLPGGIATDAGAAGLRRHLFDRANVDALNGFENRAGIFPIHRSIRFALLTCTTGRPTSNIACRFGLAQPDDLERPGRAPVVLTRRFLERISGADDLGIPEIVTPHDLAILEHVSARCPWLSATDGWHVQFGRELNASDDRHSFVPWTGSRDARPVLEGKQIEPFRVSLDTCRYELKKTADASRVPRRARLAYRDIASATNRLTLIAAVIPARAVTTHTLFCLKTPLPTESQHVLCSLLNSLVANYLVRMRVNTHVTVSLVSRLPVPMLRHPDETFLRLAALSRALRNGAVAAEQMPEYPELQALVARLYGLTTENFAHVLGTFPLLAPDMKSTALSLFNALH